MIKVVHDRYSIASGHIETCHSYTNDQNLIDNYHKHEQRGRGAPLNMVITDTGAASTVVKVLPELKGRLTANAIRVPTLNVSLAILNLNLERAVGTEEINTYLRDISLDVPLGGQIDYTSSPEVVSSNFVGNERAGIIDSGATITLGQTLRAVRVVRQRVRVQRPGNPHPAAHIWSRIALFSQVIQ